MDKIYLRAIETNDYTTTFQWRNDDEISSMVGGQKYFVSLEKEKQWIERVVGDNSTIRLMVCLKEGNKPIGMVTLADVNYVNRSAHSHILIGDKSEWGKGYGTVALKQLLDYAFEEMGLHRVEAMVLESNVGSVKMHKKCGYTEEGVKRESIYKNGKYHNQLIMSVLCDEFFSVNKTAESSDLQGINPAGGVNM